MPTVASIKSAVRKRDGHRCTECGLSEEEHRRICGKRLEVHRVVPGTPYSLDSAVTLCGACHKKKPRSAAGRSDSITFHLPRRLFLDTIGLESVEGVSANKLLARLLQSVPQDVPQAVVAELRQEQKKRKERKTYRTVKLARDLVQKARFIAKHSGVSVTHLIECLLRPALAAMYEETLRQIRLDPYVKLTLNELLGAAATRISQDHAATAKEKS